MRLSRRLDRLIFLTGITIFEDSGNVFPLFLYYKYKIRKNGNDTPRPFEKYLIGGADAYYTTDKIYCQAD